MAFPNIDVTKPLGTYRVSTIDDYERETRRWLRDCMMEISGYPNSSGLKIMTWTNDTRPQDPAVGVFGYNIDKDEIEFFDGTDWVSATHALPEIYDKARKDQNGNVINTTYATKSELTAATSVMVGATANAAGEKGLVPKPAAGKQASFLRGDGTWASPTNTTYTTGTAAQLNTGTDNTGQLWSASVLKAFVNAAAAPTSTVSANGYLELANGLVLQWGAIPADSNSNNDYVWVDFVRDLSECYFITTSDFNPSNTSYPTRNHITTIQLGTSQRFRVRAYDNDNGGDHAWYEYGGQWFAIGKKK